MRHSLLNHKAYKIVGYGLIIGIIIILILPWIKQKQLAYWGIGLYLFIHVRRLDMHFLTTSWKRYCSRTNNRIYSFFSRVYIIAILYCFVRCMMTALISILETTKCGCATTFRTNILCKYNKRGHSWPLYLISNNSGRRASSTYGVPFLTAIPSLSRKVWK